MQNEKKSTLSDKEQLFCGFYVSTGNSYDAAVMAGYKRNATLVGEKLLNKKSVQSEIEKIAKFRFKTMQTRAVCGYERLAFGNVSDAVKLLSTVNPETLPLDEMDFFNVSEIRRLKDGAMEIKFFDRIKAIEKLEELSGGNSSGAVPFYKALEKSTLALNLVSRGDDSD